MKEVISIHIGQAGCQLGSSMWELFNIEHGIGDDGLPLPTSTGSKGTFYEESSGGCFVPRSLFIDFDPIVVDRIRNGKQGKIFHPENMISGKEDAANNYCRGKYTLGRDVIDMTLDRIRKMANNCDSLQGIMIYNAIGGGTGSGFGSLLTSKLSEGYKTIPKILVSMFPSPQISNVIVEPFNAVLSLSSVSTEADVCFMMDNEAVYDICRRSLDITANYANLNSVIAQTVSSLTSAIRFDGSLNCDVKSFPANLCPFPRIMFAAASYAPILNSIKAYNEAITVPEITFQAFDRNCMLTKIDPLAGKYIAATLMYRGDIVPKDVNACVLMIKNKKTVNFVDWCPTGIKCGLSSQLPSVVPGSLIAKTTRSVCMAGNTTACAEVFKRIGEKFDKLYEKRAFVHWFVGEGMESGEFAESREHFLAIQKEYETLGMAPTQDEATN